MTPFTFVGRRNPVGGPASVVAAVSLLTACAGGPAEVRREPREERDPNSAAVRDDRWWPVAAADPSAIPRVQPGGDPPSAPPFASTKSQGSDMSDAVESVETEEPDDAKSYLIPAVEIVAFEFLLNQFDRRFVDQDVYGSDVDSFNENLHRGWVIDQDPFKTNQFGHPYSGSIYHGFARSAGLNYWEALGYDFLGSALWEVAGETDPPSFNDQVTTTFAGSFLGEALFRTANLVLESANGKPGIVRHVAASLIAPSAAVNRYAFGDRFAGLYRSNEPAISYWLGVGARRNTTLKDASDLTKVTDIGKDEAVAAFSLDFGLPGKPGYRYERPFDYFHFESAMTTNTDSIPENINVRGLLIGKDYESGPDYDGVWGLYGSYDFFSPTIFKVSSTALSVGTTAQYLMSEKFALQGTAMGGIGYTATGTNAETEGIHAYRYAASPQALLNMRASWSDVATFGFTVNDFLLSGGGGSGDSSGTDNILRAQCSLTVRVYGRHAIGLQYITSSRDAGITTGRQSVGAVNLFYMFLGDEEFGVVRH